MIVASFQQLLFAWGLYLTVASIVLDRKAEPFHRLVIWFALWLILTPVDPSFFHDLLWEVVCFLLVESIFNRVRKFLRWL